MATSAVAYGKIEIALRKKEPVPKGWIVDTDGRETTDPQQMIDGGAQLPLGSEKELGGHKGYALATMVDILCCVLSGANWGPFAPPFALRQGIPERSVGKGIGHFFGAMQIDGFIDKDQFKKQIDEWIRVFRKTKPAPGTSGPLIPGDPEREAEVIRSKEGIPLIKPVVDDLLEMSEKTGIPFEISRAI
jgi:LDH2 family malate/lactate/ureidoglycolate dehydrogenase